MRGCAGVTEGSLAGLRNARPALPPVNDSDSIGSSACPLGVPATGAKMVWKNLLEAVLWIGLVMIVVAISLGPLLTWYLK